MASPTPTPSPTGGQEPKIILHDTPTPSPALLEALNAHLPFSLPVLRRIQFAGKFPGGSTPSTHILYATTSTCQDDHDTTTTNNGIQEGGGKHFAAAYLDLSRYPETQAWFYNTLEDFYPDPDPTAPFPPTPTGSLFSPPTEEEKILSDSLTLAVLRRMYEISASPGPESEYNGHDESKVPVESVREKRKPAHKHTVLIGSLHETIRQRLLAVGVCMVKTKNIPPEIEWEFCNKWLFRIDELSDIPQTTSSAGGGDDGGAGSVMETEMEMVLVLAVPPGRVGVGNGNGNDKRVSTTTTTIKIKFDKVRRQDIPLIRSRTSIDRKEDTLLRLPSLVLRRVYSSSPSSSPSSPSITTTTMTSMGRTQTHPSTKNVEKEQEQQEQEKPIAWAFTSLDGTLMTLHVEPAYRGNGLAKLIATKIMRDCIPLYGPDGWGAADVFVQNTQSQGVCRSIGGRKWWTLSWAVLDLSTLPLPSLRPSLPP